MNRFISVIAAALILLQIPLPTVHAESFSGRCGDRITWILEDGVLTLSGSGSTYDYESQNIWKKELDETSFAAVQTIIVREGIIRIGSKFFSGFSNVTAVELPNTVTSFGTGAFAGCGLHTLNIPDGITELPEICFSSCQNLESVFIPDSVVRIGTRCFTNCPMLTELRLPENDYVVLEESSLPQNWVQQQGEYAVFGNGILYQYNGTAVEAVVPDEVRTVSAHAFRSYYNQPEDQLLRSVVINEGCNEIDSAAFNFCYGLQSLTIPDSVTQIASDAVTGVTEIQIKGEPLSAAHAFAVQNGYEFVPLHEEQFPPERMPDYDKDTFSFGNNPGLFSGEYRMTDWAKAMLLDDTNRPERTAKEAANKWAGSCYGLSYVTVLAAAGLIQPNDLDPDSVTLHDVKPTEQAISVINYYHILQSAEELSPMMNSPQNLTAAIRCAHAYQNGGNPFVLKYFKQNGSGHAVVGYGVECGEWEWDGVTYDRRIRTWDCNYSEQADKSQLYFDSQTLRWRIPAYGVYYTDSTHYNAMLTQPEGNADRLNHYAYFDASPLPGDADLSGGVHAADAVYLARFISEQDNAPMTHRGAYNADTDGDGILTIRDAVSILKMAAP